MAGPEIVIGATTDQANAQIALLQARIKSFNRDIAGMARGEIKLDAKEASAGMVELAAKARTAQTEIAALKAGAESSAGGLGRLGAESKHVIAIFDEFSRGARGQMVGSVVALTRDSGALGAALGALKSPMGLATAGGLALAGALFVVVRAAIEARNALDGVYNTALANGRNALAAVANAKEMVSTLTSTGLVSQGKAMPLVAALQSIPYLSDRAKASLAGVADAWTRVQFGGDYEKAAKEIPKLFSSIATMKELIDQKGMLTGGDYQMFAQAAGEKDIGAAGELLAKGLRARYSAAAQSLADQAEATTGGLATALGAQAGAPMGPTVYKRRLPGPLSLPSQEEMDANRYIAEGNKEEYERLGILRQIKEIQDQIAKGHVDAATGNAAIKRLQDQADELQRRAAKQSGAPDFSATLDAAMHAAEATAAAHATSLAAAHQAMLKADIGVLGAQLRNPSLTAAQRLSVQSQLSQRQGELSLAGLRSAGAGARSGAAAQRQDYAAFAAEERDKLAAARGNAGAQAAILDQWRAKAAATYQAGSAAFRKAAAEIEKAAQGMAAATIEQLERMAAAQAHADESILRGFKSKIQIAVTRGTITPQQGAGFDIQEAQTLANQQKGRLDQVMSSPQATPQQRQNAYWQEWDLGDQTKAQIAGLQEIAAEAGKKAAAAFAAPFRAAFDRIGGSLQQALTGALTGEKGKQITQQLDKSLVGSGVSLLTGTASRVAAGPLSGLLGQPAPKPGQGVGDVLGGAATSWVTKGLGSLFPSMGKLFGGATQNITQTANTTALTVLTTALTANTSALLANSATTATGTGTSALSAAGSAGGVIGGIKSAAGFLGLAKGGIVPAAAGGWVVPSAARGWSLPASFGSDRVMAALTPGEMVLPTAISRLVQHNAGVLGAPGAGGAGGAAAGDFHAHFHGPSDAPQVARFFHNNRRHVVSIVREAMRGGALNPRG